MRKTTKSESSLNGSISIFLIGIGLLTPASILAAGAPSISAGGVVSAGAFGGFTSIAPGSWIEIYGSNLAVDSRSWAGSDFNGVNAPTSLDGTKVTIGGQPAFIDYISSGQVNVQVPSGIGTGSQSIVVTTASGASSPSSIIVKATQPGLLAPSSFNVGGTQYATALFSDGATYVLPPGAIPGLTSRRAKLGDTITLYGIGFGSVVPDIPAGQIVQQDDTLASTVQINFGTNLAQVMYDGLAPGAIGLYQFNVVVPSVPSSDAVPLTFTLGGVAGTQTLYIAVQNGNPAPQVQSLTLSATSVAAGGTVQGTVTLSTAAPAGGVVVALSSSSSAASVPATVTVAAGATLATFTVSTSTVSSNQAATITASYGGGSAQTTLTVTASGGGTLPQFSFLSGGTSGAQALTPSSFIITPDIVDEATIGAGIIGTSELLSCVAAFTTYNVRGATITPAGLDLNNSTCTATLSTGQTVAGITSANVKITLSPVVPNDSSGNASWTVTIVSSLGTINQSYTGTYTASFN